MKRESIEMKNKKRLQKKRKRKLYCTALLTSSTILSMRLFSFSVCFFFFSPNSAARASRSCFCRSVREEGVLILTFTCRSPLPRPCNLGIPFPLSRNTVPVCVPGGTLILARPPKVGTSSSAPRAAWVKLMGVSRARSLSIRWNNGWGRTFMTT